MAKKKTEKLNYRINNQIRQKEVRIVGNIEQSGEIVSINDALNLAKKLDLDLVEINSNANPSVCKVIDYSKFLYELKKKKKEQEKKQKENAQSVKELRFGPNTDEHDYKFKKKHAEKFLKNNDIVKAYVFFKGREIQYKDKGELLLIKLINDLSDFGIPETNNPKLEGKKMIINIKPKKK